MRPDPLLRRVLVALLAWGLLACAGRAPAPAAPAVPAVAPLVWRADGSAAGEGRLFLLGSVHLGNRQLRDLGPVVERAWQRSDELVVEIDLTEVSPADAAELTERYGRLPEGRRLRDVLSPETQALLLDYLRRRDLDPRDVETFKPWFLSWMLVQLELGRAGYDLEYGVDNLFIARAADRVPIVALESMASQLQMIDSMSAPVQELMLKDVVVAGEQVAAETEDLLDAWVRGDEARLSALVFRPLAETPGFESFYDLVFFQRNRAMLERLVELARDGRTRFVVLGAGHMLGEQGIPALLAARGWRVRTLSE